MSINQADLIRNDLFRVHGKEEMTRRSRAEGKMADCGNTEELGSKVFQPEETVEKMSEHSRKC